MVSGVSATATVSVEAKTIVSKITVAIICVIGQLEQDEMFKRIEFSLLNGVYHCMNEAVR